MGESFLCLDKGKTGGAVAPPVFEGSESRFY